MDSALQKVLLPKKKSKKKVNRPAVFSAAAKQLQTEIRFQVKGSIILGIEMLTV